MNGKPPSRAAFSLMALLSGRKTASPPPGLVANGCSTDQQLEFRRKSSDNSNNILEVWRMAALVLGLSRPARVLRGSRFGKRTSPIKLARGGSDLRAKVGVAIPREL